MVHAGSSEPACPERLYRARPVPCATRPPDCRPSISGSNTSPRSPKQGSVRQVKAAIKAVAFGSEAETLGKQAIGSRWQFTGFLATPRNGKHPVLHIQSFQQD